MAEVEFGKKTISNSRSISTSIVWRAAAAIAFIMASYFGGSWILERSEMKDLRSELLNTKEQLLISMMKQESASERLKGIFASQEIESADDDIIDALVFAMNKDSNINVRIAATEALSKFSTNEKVRASLIASLNQQEYPAVQLKLIDILVALGDKKALEPMQEITDNEEVMKTVRDEAQMGIFKLM